ncbi:claudin-15-like isoform X2 [Clupea harengus]|uniref:Claudin n=1 Tax=Clupea harengus TaxID=7950 RepID=A0A6P8FYF5_CLUHA|nr:claudin-15-like isoform X2 [Clupea harengus]
MRDILEVAALCLGFLSWATVGISLQDQYWKESTTDGSVITTSTIYGNLWMSCASDSTGIYNCHDFQSLLALPVLGTFGITSTLFGMQCSKVGGDNYTFKGRIVTLGGLCFLLQGLSTIVGVSWYAFNITQEFFDPLYPGIKYEIGNGLYIGWSSALLALCGGFLLLWACNLGTSENIITLPSQPLTRSHKIGRSQSQSTCSQYEMNAYV